MKHLVLFCFLAAAMALLIVPAQAQWKCVYSTYDAEINGTGHNTPSVGVISENTFIALIMTPDARNFMIPYVNADSALGRKYTFGYGSATAGIYQLWSDQGFDQVTMLNAAKIVARPDSTIYVANNDANHNILVFKFANDTIDTFAPYYRNVTGSNSIFGIAVDQNGYVYVCNDTTSGQTDDIKIFPPFAQWTTGRNDAPIRTIDLPDGKYFGITTTPDGSKLFVCDSTNRKILKFVGTPATGYTADASFNFQLGAADTVEASTLPPVPINLAYLSPNNILFAAVDVHGYSSAAYTYSYGRIYLLNPNTGALASTDSSISIIDCAKWNLDVMGSYTGRGDGTAFGNASGYTSTYDVAFDENGNLYTQSHFGWTIDKWVYEGTLPVLSSVERISPEVPGEFRLSQNYPNPFNPTTVIEFTMLKSGPASLIVYDLLGREVKVLVNGTMDAGTYKATFDARDLTGGTYFYTLKSGDASITKKMVLVK